jgi:hypothetical protein
VVQAAQALELLLGEVFTGLFVVGGLWVLVANVKSCPEARGTGAAWAGGIGGHSPV